MPSAVAAGYPHPLGRNGVIRHFSQSTPSVSSPLGLSGPATDTSTSSRTALPPPSTFDPNLDVSAAPTSTWTISSPTLSLGTNLPSASAFSVSFTSAPILSPESSSTQTVSSLIPVASHSSTQSTSSPSAPLPFTSSSPIPVITGSPSTAPGKTTTVVETATVVTSASPSFSSVSNSPSTSTFTITSVMSLGGTTTTFVIPSGVLSTESPGSAVVSVHISPGSIAAIVLGIIGAFAFAGLWIFCASRRHRKLVQEAALIPPENPAPGPLDEEMLDVDDTAYDLGNPVGAEDPTNRGPDMGERYAGILAALHSSDTLARRNEGGSAGGVYGSRRDITTDTDEDEDIARASSPTLPLRVISSDDPPYTIPLSLPQVSSPSYHQATQPVPPPSAYHTASRRKGSPGPDATAWMGGNSIAPSYNSHYTRSQTLGSGSGSGSFDALTRTRSGSEELLLGVGKGSSDISGGASASPTTDPRSNRIGLGSIFGSPAASIYSPSGAYTSLQYDTSGSHDGRTVSRSRSYGYTRSGTPSSFDILRSVSSQGALSSTYSHSNTHDQNFRFGLSRPRSSSSGSTGKKPVSNRPNFGVPPTSFKAWKDRGSAAALEKERQGEKQSLKEDRRHKTRSSISSSTSESTDEKQGSPVRGVRALLGRLRRAGRTPSPHSSNRDPPSSVQTFMDVDPEMAYPVQIHTVTSHRRRPSFILSNPDPHPPSPYSWAKEVVPMPSVSLHQDPHPFQHETYDSQGTKSLSSGTRELQLGTTLPTGYILVSAPSPVPTEESRLAEGLLHPRLRTQGHSDASLMDFEDYSRPIGGVVKNRMYSTTTFGTQDDAEASPSRGTPVHNVVDEHEPENEVDVLRASTPLGAPRDSWITDDLPQASPTMARYSLPGRELYRS